MKIEGLGQRLKDARNDAGISQKQCAELIGKKTQTISSYENGNTEPALHVIRRLAGIYHVTTDWLLGLDNRKMIAVESLNDRDYDAIIHLINRLTE